MKFFNRLRENLIPGKGFRKYLLYAIGEIILVVIGILIAVSLNNANEERKRAKEVSRIAEQVYYKIDKDLIAVQNLRLTLSEDRKLFDLYLSREEKTERDKLYITSQTPFLVTMGLEFLDYNPTFPPSFEKATANNTLLSEKLLQIEQYYVGINRELQLTEDFISKELVANLNHIKMTYDWYEKLVAGRKFSAEEFSYFYSTDYRNRVVHMKFLYLDGYESRLEQFEYILTDVKEDLWCLL